VVHELRYILTPKKEGNFTIGPAKAKIGMQDRSRRDMFGMFFGQLNWIPVISDTVGIEVLPQRVKTDMVGAFTINASLDNTSVEANKPVNLMVHIEGEGSLEDFEFPEFNIDGVTVYSDEAKIESKVSNGKIMSSYTKSFAFIGDSDFTIPSRTFTSYNPNSGQVERLNTASYEVKVKDAKSEKSDPKEQSEGIVQTNIEAKEDRKRIEEPAETSTAWWMIAAAYLAGLLSALIVMALFPMLRGRRRQAPYRESEALKVLYPHINSSKEVEEMVRKLYARKNGDKGIEIDKKALKEMVERFR
jgi:hypothetical protein